MWSIIITEYVSHTDTCMLATPSSPPVLEASQWPPPTKPCCSPTSPTECSQPPTEDSAPPSGRWHFFRSVRSLFRRKRRLPSTVTNTYKYNPGASLPSRLPRSLHRLISDDFPGTYKYDPSASPPIDEEKPFEFDVAVTEPRCQFPHQQRIQMLGIPGDSAGMVHNPSTSSGYKSHCTISHTTSSGYKSHCTTSHTTSSGYKSLRMHSHTCSLSDISPMSGRQCSCGRPRSRSVSPAQLDIAEPFPQIYRGDPEQAEIDTQSEYEDCRSMNTTVTNVSYMSIDEESPFEFEVEGTEPRHPSAYQQAELDIQSEYEDDHSMNTTMKNASYTPSSLQRIQMLGIPGGSPGMVRNPSVSSCESHLMPSHTGSVLDVPRGTHHSSKNLLDGHAHHSRTGSQGSWVGSQCLNGQSQSRSVSPTRLVIAKPFPQTYWGDPEQVETGTQSEYVDGRSMDTNGSYTPINEKSPFEFEVEGTEPRHPFPHQQAEIDIQSDGEGGRSVDTTVSNASYMPNSLQRIQMLGIPGGSPEMVFLDFRAELVRSPSISSDYESQWTCSDTSSLANFTISLMVRSPSVSSGYESQLTCSDTSSLSNFSTMPSFSRGAPFPNSANMTSAPSSSSSACPPLHRPVSQETIQTVLASLLHNEDCLIPRCTCHEAKRKLAMMMGIGLQHSGDEPHSSDTSSSSSSLSDRRKKMRLPLKYKFSMRITSRTHQAHIHHHLTTKSHMIHTPGYRSHASNFQRRRSKSVDLTPIYESPMKLAEDPTLHSPLYLPSHGPPTTSGDSTDAADGLCSDPEPEPDFQRKFLLREISISADNIPAVCVNDCPLTPTPLRFKDRSLAATVFSPVRQQWSSWIRRPMLEGIPVQHIGHAHTVPLPTSERRRSHELPPTSDPAQIWAHPAPSWSRPASNASLTAVPPVPSWRRPASNGSLNVAPPGQTWAASNGSLAAPAADRTWTASNGSLTVTESLC